MSDDLFSRYGRAVFEAAFWASERDRLSREIHKLARSAKAVPLTGVQRINPQAGSARLAPAPENARRSEVWDGLTQVQLEQFAQHGRYRGLLKEVAIKFGVSPQYVSRVVNGKNPSRADGKWQLHTTTERFVAVLNAVVQRMAEIDANLPPLKPLPPAPPITDAERAAFKLGGRYYGLTGELSRSGRCNPQTTRAVLAGQRAPQWALHEIRRAMESRDRNPSGGAA